MTDSVGIEYLIAVLRQNNHKVSLYLDEGGFKPWKNNQSAKVDFGKIYEFIEENSFKILFFSVSTDFCQRALAIARGVKKKYPGLIICFGGPHATYSHEYLTEQDCIDFVCRGDGEIAIIELLRYIKGEHSVLPEGLYRRCEGKILGKGYGRLVENLDELPFPDKSDFYLKIPIVRKIYSIVVSRGCYNRCTYCNSPVIKNSYKDTGQVFFRRRSIDNVMRELRIAKEVYRPQIVVFNDDTFIFDKKYMLEFARRYHEEVNIPFTCSTQPNFFDEETLDALAKAGLCNVEVGLQSFDEEIRMGVFGRRESNNDIFSFVKSLKERGVYVHTDHILNPWENGIKLKEQLYRYNELRPHWINVFYLFYYPGVPIIEKALKDGLLSPEQHQNIKEGIVERNFFYGGHLSKSQLRSHKRYILFLSFLPIMPKGIAHLLLRTDFYFIFNLVPRYSIFVIRALNAILRPKDTWGRFNLIHLIYDILNINTDLDSRRIGEISNIAFSNQFSAKEKSSQA